MPSLDLMFPTVGSRVPLDHGYILYSALSRHLPSLHGANGSVRIAPIAGTSSGESKLAIDARKSTLRLRLPADLIPIALPLAGLRLNLGEDMVRLGVPHVRALTPAPTLYASIVTIKGFTEPAPFLEAARRQLKALEIQGEPAIPLVADGPRRGEPRRRVLRIKDKRVVGFSLLVGNLTAEESIRLQEHGLGGRAHMGCGFFLPFAPRRRQ